MAVTAKDQTVALRVEYKPEYDASGNLELKAYSQTFTQINEETTYEQKKAFVDALMSLTIYATAPYVIKEVSTAQLAVY